MKVNAKNQNLVITEPPQNVPGPILKADGHAAVPKSKSLWGVSIWAILVAIVAIIAVVVAAVALVVFGDAFGSGGGGGGGGGGERSCALGNSSGILRVSDDGKFSVRADSCMNTSCEAGLECLANVCDSGPCCVVSVTVRNAVELEAAIAAGSEVIVLEDSVVDDLLYLVNESIRVTVPTLLVGPGRMQNSLRAPVVNANAIFELETCAAMKLSSLTITKSGFTPTFVGDTSAIEIQHTVINEPVCGEGWVNFDGQKCVQTILLDETLTWNAANLQCGSYGGRLFSVTELQHLEQLGLRCFQCVDAWIGGQVTSAGDQVAFTNGITTFEDWFIFEGGVLGNADTCLSLGTQFAGLWRTYDCTESRQFLCERDIDHTTASTYYGMIEPSPTARITTKKNRLVVDSYASMELIVSNLEGDDGVEYDDDASSRTFAIPDTLEITVLVEHPTGATICELEAVDDDGVALEIRAVDSGDTAAVDGDGDSCITDTAVLLVVALPFTGGKLDKILLLNSTIAGGTVTVDNRETTAVSTVNDVIEIPVTISKFRIVALGSFDNTQIVQFASDVSTPTSASISNDGLSIVVGTDSLPRFYQYHRVSAASGLIVEELSVLEVYSYGNTGIARLDLNRLFLECVHVRFLGAARFAEYTHTGTGIVFERDLSLDYGSTGCRQLSLWSEPSLPVQYELLIDTPTGQSGSVLVTYPETLFTDGGEVNEVQLGSLIELRPAAEIPRNLSIDVLAGQACVTTISILRYGQTVLSADVAALARLPVSTPNCETMCSLLTTQLSGEECVVIDSVAAETVVKSLQIDLTEQGCSHIVSITSGLDETNEDVCTKQVDSVTTAVQMNAEIAAAKGYSKLVLGIGDDTPPTAAPTSAPTVEGVESESQIVDVAESVFEFDIGQLTLSHSLRLSFLPAVEGVTTIIADGAIDVGTSGAFTAVSLLFNESVSISVQDAELALVDCTINGNLTCASVNSSCLVSSSIISNTGAVESEGDLTLEYSTISSTGKATSRGILTLQNMIIENENELVSLSEIGSATLREARPSFAPDIEEIAPPIGTPEEEGMDSLFSNVSSFESCTESCEDLEACHSFWYEAVEPDDLNREVGICKLCLNAACSPSSEDASYLVKRDTFSFIEYSGCLALETSSIFLSFSSGLQECKAWCTYYVPCNAFTYVGGTCRLYREDDLTDDCTGALESVVYLPERGSFGQQLTLPYAQIANTDLADKLSCSRDQVLANLSSQEQCGTLCDAHISCQGYSFDDASSCQLFSQDSPLEPGSACAVSWSPVPVDFETDQVFISVRDHFPQVEYFDLTLQCTPQTAFDRLPVASLSDCELICDVFFACAAIAFADPLETSIPDNCMLLNAEETKRLFFPGFCNASTQSDFDVFVGVLQRDFVLLEDGVVDVNATLDEDEEEQVIEEDSCSVIIDDGLVEIREHAGITSLDDCKAICSRYVGCARLGFDLQLETCYIPLPSLLRCALEDISLKEVYPLTCSTPDCFQHETLSGARDKCLELGYENCQGVVKLGNGTFEVRAPSRLVQTGVKLSLDNTTTTTFLFECLSEFKELSVDEENRRRLKPTPLFSLVSLFFFLGLEFPGFTENEVSVIPHPVQPTVFNTISKAQDTEPMSTYRYVESPTNQVSWLVCFSVVNNFAFSGSSGALVSADYSREYRLIVNQGGRVDVFVRDESGEANFTNSSSIFFTNTLGIICHDGLQQVQFLKNSEVFLQVPAVCDENPANRLFPEMGVEKVQSTVCHVDFITKPVASEVSQAEIINAERAALHCQGNETAVYELAEQAISQSKTDYVHAYEYFSFLNTAASGGLLEERFDITRDQCEKFCDVHFLCSGYVFRTRYNETTPGLGGAPIAKAAGTTCILVNSVFVAESETFLYEEFLIVDMYVSTANPFRDLYTALPEGSCFLFNNFANDTVVENLLDEVACQRECFETDNCIAFTWDKAELLCTIHVNADYTTVDCPESTSDDLNFIAGQQGFYAEAVDVVFGSTPIRDYAFYQDSSLIECQTLCTVSSSCVSLAHGTLTLGVDDRSGVIYEDACILLGKTLEILDAVDVDLNDRFRKVTTDDINNNATDLTFFNFFDVYSFTTISTGTSRSLCPKAESLILSVEDTDLFECEALCDSHEDCRSIEINEKAECKIYDKTSVLQSKSDAPFLCSRASSSTTYRVAFNQFVDPSPLYISSGDPSGVEPNELCVFGDETVLLGINSGAHCKSLCSQSDDCGAARFHAPTSTCTLFTSTYSLESCEATPQTGQVFIAHDPVQYTRLPDTCLTSPDTPFTFDSKTQEECAAICAERGRCRTFTLSDTGLCSIHDSARYAPCTIPGPTLYKRFFASPYTQLRDFFCVSRTFALLELTDTGVEGCRQLCDKLEPCNSFEFEQSGKCMLFEGADFSNAACEASAPGLRELYVSFKHVLNPPPQDSTFHGFLENTCILQDGSPLTPLGTTMDQAACETSCLDNARCRAYEHRKDISQCSLLEVEDQNATVADTVVYSSACPATVTTKLRAKTNAYKIQNLVDLSAENEIVGMTFDDKENFECIALCDFHPYCRAFKYAAAFRTCILYRQAREGFGALSSPEPGVDVYVNIHAFVDTISFVGSPGQAFGTLIELSYSECAAICVVHDACNAFTHTSNYRFMEASSLAQERRLVTAPIITGDGPESIDRFVLKKQLVHATEEKRIAVQRISHTSDNSFDHEVFLDQSIDYPSTSRLVFTASNECLQADFQSTEVVNVDGQVFTVATFGACTLAPFLFFTVEQHSDGFISLSNSDSKCLSYDNRSSIARDGVDEVSVFWAPCSSGLGTKFAFASPRFHISVKDSTLSTSLCLGSDTRLRDCRDETSQTRWMFNFRNKRLVESDVYLNEASCLTPDNTLQHRIGKVPCASLNATQGQFSLDNNGRIVDESSGLCVTAQSDIELSLVPCEIGPDRDVVVAQSQTFRDFETCELITRDTSPPGVLSRNADGADGIETTAVGGLPSSFYVQNLSSPKLLLVSYDFNRSVILIVGFTALNEPHFLDPALGDTCLKRDAFQPGLVAGPCIDNSIGEPRAESAWGLEDEGRVFFFEAGALKFVICRQGGGQAVSVQAPSCVFENSQWMMALREDFSREGTEVAIEPGPLPVLPEVPAEVLFRLWLQSPDGRLVRSMQSKIEVMRTLVDITEKNLNEADQALADATASLSELDKVTSEVVATTERNGFVAGVLADVLKAARRFPYVGPVAAILRRILDLGANLLKQGNKLIGKGQKAISNVGSSIDALGTALVSGLVVVRPPVDALDSVKEGLARLQACAFFSGDTAKEEVVEGVIRDVSQAVDTANAGMVSIVKSFRVLNSVKPELLNARGIKPLRDILSRMRPVTRVMKALGFIADLFTYVIRFKIPVIGRVQFTILDIAKAIGHFISIIKRIPFVGWVAGWIEKAVVSIIKAILPPIKLPLPSFNVNLVGPFESIRKQILDEARKVGQTLQEIELKMNGALTSMIPGNIDFETGVDIPSVLPDEIPDLPCFTIDCVLDLPELAPYADDIRAVQTAIEQGMEALGPTFLPMQLTRYMDTFVGCNETETIRMPLGTVVPENLRVDECNVGDPEAKVCTLPFFSGDDILQNVTETVNSVISFTPSQRRMLRALQDVPSCGSDYCFESFNILVTALETRVSTILRTVQLLREGKSRFDGSTLTLTLGNSVLGVSFDVVAEADFGFRFDENGVIVVPGYEVVLGVSFSATTVPREEKPWVGFTVIDTNMENNFADANAKLGCDFTPVNEVADEDEDEEPNECTEFVKIKKDYETDTAWSKSGIKKSVSHIRGLVRSGSNGRPKRSARAKLRKYEGKRMLGLLRVHAIAINQRIKKVLKKAKVKVTLRATTRSVKANGDRKFGLFDVNPIGRQSSFVGTLIRPDTQATSTDLIASALVFEFSSGLLPKSLPKTAYVAAAWPMQGGLFVPNTRPRVGIFVSGKPQIITVTGCLAFFYACSRFHADKQFVRNGFKDFAGAIEAGEAKCRKTETMEECLTTIHHQYAARTAFGFKAAFAYGLGEPLRGKPLGAK